MVAVAGPRALLLDVEGTTTPVGFVTQVLFPFAREHARAFLERNEGDAAVRALLAALRDEHAEDERAGGGPPPWTGDLDSATAYVHFLMAQDRKSTGLKALQGRIWEEGFRAGVLRGEVYPDVPPALMRWRAQDRSVAIFSSGSVLAQRLLFATTVDGDLTPQIQAHFDTGTGPKLDAESYRRIARALSQAPRRVLFVSDVAGELDAARRAGLRTALCVREGAEPDHSPHPVVRTFEALCP